MLDPSLDRSGTAKARFAVDSARRVVLCGSMTFYGEMIRVRDRLDKCSVPALLPDAEDERITSLGVDEYERFKRRVSLMHLRRVRHRSTFGILVLNLDKRGLADYIGPSTFAEIAMATAFNKRVYLIGVCPEFYADELAAWGAIALDGRLDRLIEDYRTACLPGPQLTMFAHT
jgi:hypothetical protein